MPVWHVQPGSGGYCVQLGDGLTPPPPWCAGGCGPEQFLPDTPVAAPMWKSHHIPSLSTMACGLSDGGAVTRMRALLGNWHGSAFVAASLLRVCVRVCVPCVSQCVVCVCVCVMCVCVGLRLGG